MSDRKEFEAFISAAPFEKSADRHPESNAASWPGQYRALDVQLAWESWQAARAQPEPSSGVQSSECSTCNGEGGTYEPEGHRDAMLFVCPDCNGSGDAPEPSAWAVPDGWKLVPIASTSEMDIAAHDRGIMGVSRDEAEIIWNVMLDAAPQPPQEDKGDE